MSSTPPIAPAADVSSLHEAYRTARRALMAERSEEGCWLGELSASALSTATAVSALSLVSRDRFGRLIESGLQWLARNQNADGGWGDTPDSPSNVSTTMLAEAALQLAGTGPEACARGAEGYLLAHAGRTARERLLTLGRVYGADRTFAVPILANVALAGEFGAAPPQAGLRVDWRDVPSLPFELSCCPRSLLRGLRLHVVSYALPALIAIGQLIHSRRPTRNALTGALRSAALVPALRRLGAVQPESGGFLEAVPLTSFVVMSLAASGRAEHAVVQRGVEFIRRLARPTGAWPIDSNLSTWLTTMAVWALCAGGREAGPPSGATLQWLLDRQHRDVHPYTGSAPGGWAWTHLSGGVPDADDTSGALLALARLGGERVLQEARTGVKWLLGVQNADGGWPTFCRGWGRLAFDRSAPDLTAHALRALAAWPDPAARRRKAVLRGFEYLRREQRQDGAWSPLWFGNQHSPEQQNPVYGTARVLAAYRAVGLRDTAEARRGLHYLVGAQNPDGGWGGDVGVASSVEETALAVEALSAWQDDPVAAACRRGARYLVRRVADGGLDTTAPIGLYFAKLWYSERLYPIIWTVAALGSVLAARRSGGQA